MQELGAIKHVVQKSRFYSHLYSLQNEEDIHDIVKHHRKKYRKANHHCWAYRFDNGTQLLEKSKDDGEVGHPGRVIMELLKKYELVGHALVISRIFGGIKLGVGGVSRAFREVGEETIRLWQDINTENKEQTI